MVPVRWLWSLALSSFLVFVCPWSQCWGSPPSSGAAQPSGGWSREEGSEILPPRRAGEKLCQPKHWNTSLKLLSRQLEQRKAGGHRNQDDQETQNPHPLPPWNPGTTFCSDMTERPNNNKLMFWNTDTELLHNSQIYRRGSGALRENEIYIKTWWGN